MKPILSVAVLFLFGFALVADRGLLTEERRPRRAGTATAEAPGVDLQHCREIGP
jgi:hypothetical protein